MEPYFGELFGNAHSLHSLGAASRAAVERARERIALALDLDDPSEVTFTSGATEGNQTVLRAAKGNYQVSPYEHASIDKLASAEGKVLKPGEQPTADLFAWMVVNNEIGTIYSDIPSAKQLLRDATQAIGKTFGSAAGVPPLSHLTYSAHKIHGPKGVGVLIGPPIEPLIWGEQEDGRRGGTLNVPGIVGCCLATEIAMNDQAANHALATKLKAIVTGHVLGIGGAHIHDFGPSSPFILSVGFEDLVAEPLIVELDALGYQVSSGAACSSRLNELSHVLLAYQVAPNVIRGTIRVSFSRQNTEESAEGLGIALKQAVEKLRKLRGFR